MQVFGMVGFAEGEWAMMILELWFGTIIVVGLTLAALMRRSTNFVVAALVINVVLALLYFPWMAFFAGSNDDPDWQSLLGGWRTAAAAWVGVSIVVGAASLWLLGGRSRRREPNTNEVESLAAFVGCFIGLLVLANLVR